MATVRTYVHSLSVGVQDLPALARIDLERMRLAAEVQTNLMPSATGPAFMRPALEYLRTVSGITWLREFVYGATDAALLMFSGSDMRISIDDVILTRPLVTAAITSGTFSASTGWTLTASDDATATVSGGYLNLTAAPRGSYAMAEQAVTVNEPNTEHALRIIVERGPVLFRCGSSSGGEQYIKETSLGTGTHSLAFTPTGASFYIQIKNDDRMLRRVDSIQVEGTGIVSIPSPWAQADLPKLRLAQSADVIFVACEGYQQYRIERRAARSWSLVKYVADDGPFTPDRTRKVKLKSSVTEGNGTLTASGNFFNANHVGALFKLFNEGQNMTFTLGSAGVHTDPIRVTGVTDEDSNAFDRDWGYTITGTWVADIWNQRSFDDEDSGYTDYRTTRFGGSIVAVTANVADVQQNDNDDNAIVYYRLGIKDGGYTSGAATINVNYDGGGGYGICRVVGYTSPTEVDIEVLTPFKNTTFTEDWQEGEWSANRVWPSAVCLSDGRLWWSGSDKLWGSVSDAFDSFDEEEEGDAAPINRSIATGGVNATKWLLSLQRLIAGTEGAISVAKSSSLDEPITPTNLSIRDSSTVGAAAVDPAKIDSKALFVERAGRALMELVFKGESGDYEATQLSKLTTELFSSGVKQVAVQRRPDTRIWIVMENGSCVCCLYEPQQEVLAFIPIVTSGSFESVAVLPSQGQDRVYFVVRRTIGATTSRFLEKMALDSEVVPGTLCYTSDSFVRLGGETPPPSTTVYAGLHLAGATVTCWADGAPLETSTGVPRTFVVNGSGNITVPSPVTYAVAGLPYQARYKSARLAYGAQGGTALLQKKIVSQIGVLLTNYTRWGMRFGGDFTTMYRMPTMADGVAASAISTGIVRDEEPFALGAYWDTDARVCIEINSPYTATILGLVMQVTTNE